MAIWRINIFISLMFYLCVSNLHAQVKTLDDTLSVLAPNFYGGLKTERSVRLKTDSLRLQTYQINRLNFIQNNMAQLLSDSLKQSALLTIQYGNNTRNLRLPTEPYKTQNVSLFTEGFTTIGKAKITGSFGFEKAFDDSLSNNLSGDLQNGMPFTYFAQKAGTFEHQNMNFEAGVGYNIFKNVFLTSLINYDYHWMTGSVDPRPDEKIFHVQYTPGIFFKLGNTNMGVDYVIGKTDGNIDIDYKSRMFVTSELYPDRRLYINSGYGYIAKLSSPIYTEYKTKIDGWSAHLSTIVKGISIKADYNNTLDARKNYDRIQQTDSIAHPIIEKIYSKYQLVNQRLKTLITKVNTMSVHQLSFEGIINEGTAQLMSVSSGANYLFDEHNASLTYLLSLMKQKRIYNELGIGSNLMHFTKKDFMAQHFYENMRAGFSIYGAKYFYATNHSWKIAAKPGVILPLKNVISVPETQINIFTTNIAYPEFDFYGSTLLNGQINICYYSASMLNIAGSAIVLNAGFVQKVKSSNAENQGNQEPTNGKKQFNISIGFQIFL